MTRKQKAAVLFGCFAACWIGVAGQSLIRLTTQVVGILPVANGGTGNSSGSVGFSQLPTQSFFQSTTQGGTSSALTATVGSNVYANAIYIPYALGPISTIVVSVGAADNSSRTYDLGFYGPGCFNGAASTPLAFHTGALTGSVSYATTGRKALAISGAPINGILPGWYCTSLTASTSSGTLVLYGSTAQIAEEPFSYHVLVSGSGGSTLPGTITAPSLNWLTNYVVYTALY